MWVCADAVNEVRKLDRPEDRRRRASTKWIDVDLGEQVLVAYEDDKPVYATLVSSGRAIPTPMGTYPVWAKVSAISMKNQPYEDKAYFVNKVPWSTFFQWHNAIHGAYWHDRFGVTKSHGCVNVAPLDARHLFEWVTPPLPPGWTGLRPLELLASPTVVVRNSHVKKQFRQDRPIGAARRGARGAAAGRGGSGARSAAPQRSAARRRRPRPDTRPRRDPRPAARPAAPSLRPSCAHERRLLVGTSAGACTHRDTIGDRELPGSRERARQISPRPAIWPRRPAISLRRTI